MSHLYTVSQAAKVTGASSAAIRAYTVRFARYFSTEATPGPGVARRLTADDLRLVRFVYTATGAGATREQVAERLAAKELDQFDWQPPEIPEEPPQTLAEPEQGPAMLVPIQALQAAQALLQDAQRREQVALDRLEDHQREQQQRERALQAEISHLQNELGLAKGELAGYKAAQRKPPRWWQALFGSRSE